MIDVTTPYLIKQSFSSLTLILLLDGPIPFSIFTRFRSYLQLQHLTYNCNVVREITLDFAAILALYPLPRAVQLFFLGLLDFGVVTARTLALSVSVAKRILTLEVARVKVGVTVT